MWAFLLTFTYVRFGSNFDPPLTSARVRFVTRFCQYKCAWYRPLFPSNHLHTTVEIRGCGFESARKFDDLVGCGVKLTSRNALNLNDLYVSLILTILGLR